MKSTKQDLIEGEWRRRCAFCGFLFVGINLELANIGAWQPTGVRQ